MPVGLDTLLPSPVSAPNNDDTSFAIKGDELNTKGLQFHSSAAQNGPAINGITLVPGSTSIDGKHIKMVCSATNVEAQFRDVNLWIVGVAGAQTISIQGLYII
ncbi:hypothetical protein ACSBOB_10530 [Mesorhizobium sp. ASY16-5R]|uniref:hypothetical protein n=1 Tax=Mesorhizobium sp. ASY16-5R TaxID=3445772 RepID=UPI003FA06EEB